MQEKLSTKLDAKIEEIEAYKNIKEDSNSFLLINRRKEERIAQASAILTQLQELNKLLKTFNSDTWETKAKDRVQFLKHLHDLLVEIYSNIDSLREGFFSHKLYNLAENTVSEINEHISILPGGDNLAIKGEDRRTTLLSINSSTCNPNYEGHESRNSGKVYNAAEGHQEASKLFKEIKSLWITVTVKLGFASCSDDYRPAQLTADNCRKIT